jgi:hypothetical protein
VDKQEDWEENYKYSVPNHQHEREEERSKTEGAVSEFYGSSKNKANNVTRPPFFFPSFPFLLPVFR